MRYLPVIFLFVTLSCNSNSSKEDVIVGKWQFDRTVKYGPNTDSLQAQDDVEQNKGVTAIFDKDGKYYTLRSTEGKTDTVQAGQYQVTSNGKQIITTYLLAENTFADTVTIIELTEKMMRVQTKTLDTVLLKKVE